MPNDSITTITVNFKTPDLINLCVSSFHARYPGVRHVVIDNGGCPDSLRILRTLRDKRLIDLVELPDNIGHGPALNLGLALTRTSYAFLLDSDTETKKPGFLEEMLAAFREDGNLFAIGWLRYVIRRSGVAYKKNIPTDALPYVHPYACLLDMAKFRKLPPFEHRGAPALALMKGAEAAGYSLCDYPVGQYVKHKVAGTRGLFGGRFDVGTDNQPGRWRRCNI